MGTGTGGAEKGGLKSVDSGENDSSHLHAEKEVYAACDRGAKRARDRGDYASGAVITRLIGKREMVIASAVNRVKPSGSSIKHVELERLKYVSSGYGRYLPDFLLYSTHEPCAMCAGACVWSKIGAVVFGVSQEDITACGKKHRYRGIQMACLPHFMLVRP